MLRAIGYGVYLGIFAPTVGIAVLLSATFGGVSMAAQERAAGEPTGEQVYRSACAACHGADGKGAARSIAPFDLALPDFTDCRFATREPAADWFAIAHTGGTSRGFDRRMPAFGDALSANGIAAAIEHLRKFCSDSAWPRGELNLPRPLITEKAFPEDEAVLTTSVGTGGGAISNQLLYERRFGARNQWEVALPIAAERAADGRWHHGVGDVAVAVKRVLAHSLRRGRIFSVSGEVVLPTGNHAQGPGKGTTVFEPFVTFGQLLPGNGFVHTQAGVELAASRETADEGFWRAAVGQTFQQGRFGRAWSPMVELLGARELESGSPTEWDVVPQMQITLSRRQHIMINGGVRLPLTDRARRGSQVITYFLWDWFDGGLMEGWR
jgi:mono/diheme cytochrome c family protein